VREEKGMDIGQVIQGAGHSGLWPMESRKLVLLPKNLTVDK